MSRMRVSNSQLGAYRQNPAFVIPDELQQVYSPADASTASGRGLSKVQLVQHRPSYTEGDSTSQPSYQSCIHLEVPLTSFRSVVYLYKSLLIPLFELDERRAGQSTLYRSTLSVRLGVSCCCRFPTKNEKRSCGLGHYRNPLSKSEVHKVEQMAPTCVNSKADHSDTQRHSNTLGLLSFRRTSPSNTKAGRQKGNADEEAFLTQGNSRQKKHTSNTAPESGRWSKKGRSDKMEEHQEHNGSRELQQISALDMNCSRPKSDSLKCTSKTLSLKEALELFRPDFISRSQGRVMQLEQRAVRRRALRDTKPDLVQGHREDCCKQKRNCTTPDPLSDNLFKPRERYISGREMQLRSRRIYNKLPEVTKKKEEEKKRTISQTNRLRVEVFKKRLLDQILQR